MGDSASVIKAVLRLGIYHGGHPVFIDRELPNLFILLFGVSLPHLAVKNLFMHKSENHRDTYQEEETTDFCEGR